MSHMVCPSVSLHSRFSFNVPVLALNSVILEAVLLYKSCSSLIVCLNFLYNYIHCPFFLHIFLPERVIPGFDKLLDFCWILMFCCIYVFICLIHLEGCFSQIDVAIFLPVGCCAAVCATTIFIMIELIALL